MLRANCRVAFSVFLCTSISFATAGDTGLIPGFVGEPVGGFRDNWHTHLGMAALFGVRQNGGSIEWKSAPLPQSQDDAGVTFVWNAALGHGPARGANFSLLLNGKKIADFDVTLGSVQFPCEAKQCRLRYEVLFNHGNVDSSGRFYLTVPASMVTPGMPVDFRVEGKDLGSHTWFALLASEDLPSAIPDRTWDRSR